MKKLVSLMVLLSNSMTEQHGTLDLKHSVLPNHKSTPNHCFLRLWQFCVTFRPVGAPYLEPSLSATFAGQFFWPGEG